MSQVVQIHINGIFIVTDFILMTNLHDSDPIVRFVGRNNKSSSSILAHDRFLVLFLLLVGIFCTNCWAIFSRFGQQLFLCFFRQPEVCPIASSGLTPSQLHLHLLHLLPHFLQALTLQKHFPMLPLYLVTCIYSFTIQWWLFSFFVWYHTSQNCFLFFENTTECCTCVLY